jgi:PAS domain S-box-containing protein
MGEKASILIVDDDESICKTLSLIFSKKGYGAETAGSGREAIEKAQERFFNLALIDIKLPDMEGVELLRPLKKMHPDMAVLMVTAYASVESTIQALKDGTSAYITKPLNMDEVLSTVSGALEKQRLLREKRHAEELLQERVKELTCLYAINHDMRKQLSLEGVCRGIVKHLVPAMRFPEITIPVIELDNRRFTSKKYTKGLSHGLHAEIRVGGEACGTCGVYYSEDKPFLIPEEQNLISAIAEDFSMWLEHKQAEERLIHLNLVLSTIRKVNQLVAQEKDRGTLLKAACENLTKTRGYFNAWIALLDEDGRLVTTAEAGLGRDFLPMVKQLKRGEITICGQKALMQPGAVVTEDPLSTCSDCPLADKYAGRGALTVRLEHGGKNFGILSASIPIGFLSDEEEQSLFQEVSADIAFALHSIEEEERRKQAEEALRESESKYRTLVDNIPQKIFTKDRASVYVSCNENFAQDLGIRPDQCAGKTDYDFFPRELADKYRADDKRIMETGQTEDLEEKYLQDGQEVWVQTLKTPIRQEDGTVIGILGVFWDITERRSAQQELKESEEKYRTLVESSTDAILMTDKERKVVTCNQAFFNLFGYKKREIEGKSIRIIHQSDESFDSFGKTAYPVIKRTGSLRTEWEFMHKDGSIVPVEAITSAIRSPDGSITGYNAIIRDITARKQAEEEHRKVEVQLVQAQRMEALGTLAGGIAHDFNNILSAVIGYTELVREDVPEGTKAHANLQEVYKAGIRAKDLVGQILAFSRQREHEQKPVRISSIIKEALGLLRPLLPTTIEIRQNIQTESDTVLADPSQIHQVLMNLCTNASHAMHETGGILELTLEEVDIDTHDVASYPGLTPGAYVRLSVSDTGHGMNRSVMKRIFDPYFTTKKKGVGTGLGLAVVNGIVRTHGGAITVCSEPDKGTTYHVYLPRIGHPEAAVEAEEIKPFPTGHEHILFVDDEKPLIDIGKQTLERLGYKVTTRTSSTEALEAFRAQPEKFELVITDQTMPTMAGETLAKELTQIRPDTPVILCTGYSEIRSEQKLTALGIREVLRKPIIVREMANTIRRVLDKSEGK